MAGGARAFTAVLTRPDGQSAGLAAQLADAGCDVLEFPLIDIAPVDDPAPLAAAFAALADYALVIFVSPNAIDRALAQYGAIWPNALPVGVVGPGSVAALERHGIAPPAYRVIAPQPGSDGSAPHYDSEGLFASIEAAFGGAAALAGKRVLIVRGDGGREWLADRLREAGADVTLVAAYRRVVPEPRIGTWERVHALLGGEPHAWLVTSSEGVRNLHELARAHLNDTEIEALKHAPLVTPHPRIEQTARALGFDRITLTGAGDERIVRAFRTMADEAVQPATAAPVTKRMTDTNDSKSVASQPAAASAPPSQPSYTASEPPARRGGSAVLWFVVVVLGCAAGVGGYALNRKIDRLDDALVARQKTLDAQVAETRTKTEQALASTHQVDTQLAQLDGKLADAQSAQQALQQQYQDLSRNRDAWMLEEVDQMLSSASQQLQLTGNTQLALIALQNADARLATSQSAQAVTVRKALAQDIEKLKAAPSADLTGLAIKLDDAIARIDALPLSGEAIVPHAAPKAAPADTASAAAAAAGEPRWKTWWHDFSSGLTQQLKGLVQVRRIDNADAMLASPDQGYFVRENVKLRLLAARLSLLARNESAMKADLHAAQASVGKYFDQASKDTQTVEDLLKQVDGASLTVAVPNLNTSLNAVQQFKSRG
ncbi:bifunctional uroporphyrinogen-III synthetase/uroporphyrin-III C-methyltransferase [Burkholderia multivorans]|uniref:Bifunctional uroporphyrinogen-III synthetase/uroporphyrin-III C-methyltransferase n=1 Tax=Burkholderia multivorans TaxID=87883 RepID=A0ABD7LIC5_9BURK|nr:fused uroporphyrinogen-III synthase HemD/membrane protein HemX [Burkholderia multivorans]MBJ9938988.1 fused uroporphyrinogen-III synthase HemD/membrane protein HemX [Burkholderia multivorans]MBU9285614.1 fused uroporphyrinogen-III synthase HemD/membrane protein HemX [Burkholderia multivorans]SAK15585.1 bifunctional uroporphyrinogen-III synthetase/uroporphyrin-III C-methyltransferase [Burkholderia multivorans]SAK17870.1 bifunctional uroporphyrinogen-III synthetase/uroporphyrin-III C-methyltra